MEWEYLLRVVIAGLCGALIGYERKSRMKEAGIRTHFVVSLGAALIMVISKYGFQDQSGWHGVVLDPSRIAAQIVSGVGFLGAGMIFMQRHTIKGLTTAAGIWATAGVGMAIGAGMFLLGAGATVIILIAQKILHGRFSWLATPKTEHLVMRLTHEPGSIEQIQHIFKEKGIAVIGFHIEQKQDGDSDIQLELNTRLPSDFKVEQLLSLIGEYPFIKSIDIQP
ncbi:MgtC/SapB family protein [Paenibacillus thalictri]|uniref:MgtC/SapB family protein n=1 Tax=Paenibacillus thalictri TaxID=2527873 RepID=A0A4V2J3W3_9BACL|nr:MgtC/SapB family protein [Paenibacillus thalictri]TBL75970.1 MgtC/SapB family protein [Paenibacillus thalictri]